MPTDARRAVGNPAHAHGHRQRFRRRPEIGGPIGELEGETRQGIPYLLPEIQLLYKAKQETLRKDERDLDSALPLMASDALEWLANCLSLQFPDGHPWLERIRDTLPRA